VRHTRELVKQTLQMLRGLVTRNWTFSRSLRS